jgi:hypothetical protein
MDGGGLVHRQLVTPAGAQLGRTRASGYKAKLCKGITVTRWRFRDDQRLKAKLYSAA